MRMRLGLRLKIQLVYGSLVVILVSLLTWTFLRQQEQALQVQFEKRAVALTSSLARNSEFGVIVRDLRLLESVVDAALLLDDAVGIAIRDGEGNVLVSKGRVAPNIMSKDLSFDHPERTKVVTSPVYHRTKRVGIVVAIPIIGRQNDSLFGISNRQERVIGYICQYFSLASVNDAVRQATIQCRFAALGGLILLLIVMGPLIRSITRPVGELVRATSGLASGDLSCRVAISSSDEIGGLADSFNKMADRLEKSMSLLQERATELEAANSKLSKSLQQTAALREIEMAIAGSVDLRVTLNVLLEKVTGQLRVDAADLLLHSPATRNFSYSAGRGFHTKALQHSQIESGQGHAGRAVKERRVIVIPELSEEMGELERSPFLKAEGFVAYCAAPVIAKGEVKGVLEVFHRKPFVVDDDWIELLETLAGYGAIALENALLLQGLRRSNEELVHAYDTTIEGWSRALDLRDEETEGHSQRVTEMTARLARAIGMSEESIAHVRRGALLHDIGKMAIPDKILLKPGPLNKDEWQIMQQHPGYAFDLLSPIEYLRLAVDIPYCHHEKWDGTGYPRGLTGEQIPLAARLFAIVDVWDALRSDRPYRKAWPEERVREHIRSLSGTHFDPRVVELFLSMDWNIQLAA